MMARVLIDKGFMARLLKRELLEVIVLHDIPYVDKRWAVNEAMREVRKTDRKKAKEIEESGGAAYAL